MRMRGRFRNDGTRVVAAVVLGVVLVSGAARGGQEPPVTWIDHASGHRVWRLSNEANSAGVYFNLNACTPDGRTLVYTAPDGIHALDLPTRKTRLLVADGPGDLHVSVIQVGYRTDAVFFTRPEPGGSSARRIRAIYRLDVDTGRETKLAVLPPGTGTPSINADETLAAGVYEEGGASSGLDYGSGARAPVGPDGKPLGGGLVQPANKNEMIMRRFAARIPSVLFVLNLQNGKTTTLLRTTDWLDHLLFSPTDPSLLMYGHQGPWQSLDPLWIIHADGTGNLMIHQRRMAMEIAGHAFWSADGGTIWYDLQTPAGRDFWLAGYAVATHRRTWYHLERSEWGLHYNVDQDGSLFCGDGGDPGPGAKGAGRKRIELLRPTLDRVSGTNAAEFIQPGLLHAEPLVDLSGHDYRQEPNVRFTPDGKMIVFTSNLLGPSYLFGVEVDQPSGQ